MGTVKHADTPRRREVGMRVPRQFQRQPAVSSGRSSMLESFSYNSCGPDGGRIDDLDGTGSQSRDFPKPSPDGPSGEARGGYPNSDDKGQSTTSVGWGS